MGRRLEKSGLLGSKTKTYIEAREKSLAQAFPETWQTTNKATPLRATIKDDTVSISNNWFAKRGRADKDDGSEEQDGARVHRQQ